MPDDLPEGLSFAHPDLPEGLSFEPHPKMKEPSFPEKAGDKVNEFLGGKGGVPVIGRILGAATETALEDPTQLGIGALRGAWMQGSAELGRETSS